MYPEDVLGSLIPAPESLVTMVTLEPAHQVEPLMVLEILLVLKASSAVPLPAEIGTMEVHLTMKSERHIVYRLKATYGAGKLVTVIAMSLVRGEGARLKIFGAVLTSDNLVSFLVTLNSFQVITFVTAAITLSNPITRSCIMLTS